jgi:arabinoxylan arabinofuranohydrolase
MNLKIVLPLIFAALWGQGLAQNPIVKDVGMSDPHVRVFNDSIFLYCGHDNHPNDTTWVMKEWHIFSSTDMIQWKQEGSISPLDNYMDNNSTDCWAGDATARNGKVYFYFSDRKRGIGVMASDSPRGPYKDALDKPLVSPMHDPTILVDDDQQETPYLIYGDKEGGGFHIAKLNEDMISLAEAPQPLTINGEEWQNAPQWMDKNYLFKYLDTYYLSWGRDYATSKNIYGPYECQGSLGNGHHLDEFAHGSFFWWKGQFYHLWCYYLRPGYKYRETIVTYCHFDERGRPVTDTDFLDKHFATGVGQYNASWSEIQAEWYYEKSSGTTKEGSPETGFVVSNFQNKSWLRFSNVRFNTTSKLFTANILATQGSGHLEVRADGIDGPLLGVLEVPEMKDRSPYKVLSTQLKELDVTKDIYLVFTGESRSEMSLDWFSFSR